MPRAPLPPVALTLSFVDAINRGDLGSLGALMHEDHQLLVFDEEPLLGREANIAAWAGYFASFPEYVIYPEVIGSKGDRVVVLGTTTGSHLLLPDEEEMRLRVVWLAKVDHGRVQTWQVADDTPALRRSFGLNTLNSSRP
jgi:ketosteroid isomerase-like protein